MLLVAALLLHKLLHKLVDVVLDTQHAVQAQVVHITRAHPCQVPAGHAEVVPQLGLKPNLLDGLLQRAEQNVIHEDGTMPRPPKSRHVVHVKAGLQFRSHELLNEALLDCTDAVVVVHDQQGPTDAGRHANDFDLIEAVVVALLRLV